MEDWRKTLIKTIEDPMITGIFHQLAINNTFEFITSDNQEELDVDYYLSHSGNKYISNLFNTLLDRYPDEDPLIKLSKIIENRYKENWIRIYNAMIEEYKPLENYSLLEVETPNLEDHRVTKLDQDLINESDLNDYGFNSNDPVPISHNVNKITGSGDKNKTDETINRTGTRTLTRSGNIGVTTSQQMLESEIKLRALYNMIEIIFNDVDKVLCLSIY